MGKYKGFTLTEILIAVVLMSMVILAVSSLDIVSRRFFESTSKQSQLQDEARIAMEHIVKNLTSANGLFDLGAGDPNTIWARLDRDAAGNPNNTPWDSSDDTWICYRTRTDEDGNNRITYYPNTNAVPPVSFSGATEDLADGVCEFAVNGNVVSVIITDAPINPQISLTSSVVLRAMPVN